MYGNQFNFHDAANFRPYYPDNPYYLSRSLNELNKDPTDLDYFLGSFTLSLVLVLDIYLLNCAIAKKRFLKEQTTYCQLTIWILNALIVFMFLTVAMTIARFSFISMQNEYRQLFFGNDHGTGGKLHSLWIFYWNVYRLVFEMIDLIFFLQLYEWVAVTNVILYQRNKKVEELHFMNQNTGTEV